jgi:hypothetical protein
MLVAMFEMNAENKKSHRKIWQNVNKRKKMAVDRKKRVSEYILSRQMAGN